MTVFFFGPLAMVGWFIAASIFVFCASYTWLIVIEVRGLRGMSLAIVFSCCAMICACFGLILARQPYLSNFVLGAIISAAWPPIVICSLVLCDIYAADRNNHRSFTARSYLWYRRIAKRRQGERPGSPVQLGSHHV